MATIINMPSLSPSMEEGKLESWGKKIGESLESGDLLANIETDKAVVEYEVMDDGVLRHFFIEPGDTVQVGHPIAIIADSEDEDISDLIDSAKESIASPEKPVTMVQPEHDTQASAVAHHVDVVAPTPPPAPVSPQSGRVKVSPIARKMATEQGLDLSTIRGTGPNGRIIKEDVETALKQGTPAPKAAPAATPAKPAAKSAKQSAAKASSDPSLELEGNYEEIPLTNMRRIIASRLVESTQTIPHFYLTIKVQVDALMKLRKELNEAAEIKISVNDMILKATAAALMEHPDVNARFTENSIIKFEDANVGFAVATPEGLITPVVRAVNKKGLGQIAKETKDMAKRARDKKLKIEEFTGGTFGTSNLGMFGIEEFSAIINPPQSCILAISGTTQELQMDDDGQVVATQQMKLTLSCDHRVVDGALGAQFLASFKKIMENPITLML